MTTSQVITYTIAALCCFAPLTLYLCWLATLNRRPKPTVVAGAWDFAFVLAGLSGFLAVGGVMLMDLTTRYLMRGNFNELLDGWHKYRVTWLMIGSGYLLIVAGLASLTLARRARWISVYNIELADHETPELTIIFLHDEPLTVGAHIGAGLDEVQRFEFGAEHRRGVRFGAGIGFGIDSRCQC